MERALAEDPGNADVQMTAGLLYERLNEMPKAERAYSTGYRLGKGDPNIQNNYAGFLCRTGKAVAGEKLFAEVARNPLYQTPEVALVNAGVCVRATGDLVDAERYFSRALAVHPNLPEAMVQLGTIALDRGDAVQARDLVQRYLAANPPTSEVLWLGVRAERKLGDTTAAAAYARRVQAEFPNSEQAQMMRTGIDR
jgi:type IV pilus assembly protein PilF